MNEVTKSDYTFLVQQIGSILNEGRKQAAKQINNILVEIYWNIGKYIV